MAGEDDDAVPHHDGLVDRVGDEEGGGGPLLENPQHLELEQVACLRVERGERLVHDEHARLDRQGAREAGPLLHPAGQLVRIGVLEPFQADHADELLNARCRVPAGHPPDGQAVSDVAEHRLPREEAEVLEHHAHALGRLGDRAAGDADRPAARLDQARDAAKQRGLPAAGRPDDRHDLRRPDIEGDARQHGPLAIPHAQLVDADQGIRGRLSHGSFLIS